MEDNIQTNTPGRKAIGVAVWIAIGIIIAFGAYVYSKKSGEKNVLTNQKTPVSEIQKPQTGTGDTTSAIQNDLNTIGTSSIDADLKSIDKELNSL